MFVPLLALPVAGHLYLALADAVPQFDVMPSCRGAAAATNNPNDAQATLQRCLDSERKTRERLLAEWVSFAPADRAKCISEIRGFEPTYTELATCLEMTRELSKKPASK